MELMAVKASKVMVVMAVLWAATASLAQTGSAPAQTPAPSATPQTQSGASTPAQGTPQTPPANGSHKLLQPKSQAEYQAYLDASSKTDPAQAEAAANDFATKYPDSELRTALYTRLMNLYAQANNTDKVIDLGRKAIAADPTNPIPLVQVASAMAESTRDTDLDREQRLAEAAKDAQAALDNLDTGLLLPANADPVRVEGAKRSIRTMAYDTLGMVSLNRGDYASAEQNLQKAIAESQANPEAVLYLRLSVAQDKLKQYPQALDSANKAVQYAKEGSVAQSLAKQQQERLQKLTGAQAPAGSTATPSPAPAPSPQPNASSTPH